MLLLGISGKIGTDKSELAKHLQILLNPEWVRESFARQIKRELHEHLGVPLSWCYVHKDWNFTPSASVRAKYGLGASKTHSVRDLLQWWGTEVRREENPDYWVEKMKTTLAAHEEGGREGVIIDDVRFRDEAQLVKDLGGTLVRIEPFEGWECEAVVSNHVSETALDDYTLWDFVMVPDYGTLATAAQGLVEQLKLKGRQLDNAKRANERGADFWSLTTTNVSEDNPEGGL